MQITAKGFRFCCCYAICVDTKRAKIQRAIMCNGSAQQICQAGLSDKWTKSRTTAAAMQLNNVEPFKSKSDRRKPEQRPILRLKLFCWLRWRVVETNFGGWSESEAWSAKEHEPMNFFTNMGNKQCKLFHGATTLKEMIYCSNLVNNRNSSRAARFKGQSKILCHSESR